MPSNRPGCAQHAANVLLRAAQQAFLAGYALAADDPRGRRAQVWAALIGVKMTAHRVLLFDRNWADTTTKLI